MKLTYLYVHGTFYTLYYKIGNQLEKQIHRLVSDTFNFGPPYTEQNLHETD